MCEGPGKGLLTTDSHPGTCRLPVGPIVLFACQIWVVNLMDIKKGLNTAGNGVEHIHINCLRYILGCGKNITAEVLRAEASSPAYHIQIVKDFIEIVGIIKL